MTPELKAAWLADLNSGPPKTVGHLKDDRGYCCLGRLLVVMGCAFKTDKTVKGAYDREEQWYEPDLAMVDGHAVALHSGNELSKDALRIADLRQSDHDKLTELNDERDTFADVIEYIEDNL